MKKIFFALLLLSATSSTFLFLTIRAKHRAKNVVHEAVPEAAHEVAATHEVASEKHEASTTNSLFEPHEAEVPKVEAHKAEVPKAELAKVEPPKIEAPKVETPVPEAPTVEARLPTTERQKVHINTLPATASVYINDEFLGTSPLDIELSDASQKLRIEARGYHKYEKELPTRSPGRKSISSELLIRMEKEGVSLANKSAAPKFYVQVKSFGADVANSNLEVTAIAQKLDEELGLQTKTCTANLKAKGKWLRVLVGPFVSKSEAGAVIAEIAALKIDPALPFVTLDHSGGVLCR